MENVLYIIVVIFSVIGWYHILKELANNFLYKNTDIDKNIKCQIIVENNEENVEIFVRRLMEIQNKYNILKNIEIIDKGSRDETGKILEKIAEEYPNIKLIKML